MKNFRLLPFFVLVIAVIPLGLFLILFSTILKKSIKSTVVNDPQAALAQSLNGLNGSYNQAVNQAFLAALRFSMRDSLQKSLTAPVTFTPSVKALGEAESKSSPLSFWIVTNKAGKVLYDTLGIPKPTPSTTPEAALKKKAKLKPKESFYGDIHDWPGMDRVLSGAATASGVLDYQGKSYLVSAIPVLSRSKTIGIVLAGVKIDKNFLQGLKAGSPDEVAFYSQGQTLCTSPFPPPPLPPPAKPLAVQWRQSPYLAGTLPVLGLDGKTVAGNFIAFQPVKQSLTLEGTPQKSLWTIGILLLFLTLLVAALFQWQYMSPYNKILAALDQVKTGDFNPILPTHRPDEWGHMARSLAEMTESLREKDRISLVLGKVVDPQAAKKILADRDYFALKGERRECTLLQADLKGFNTLSENMAPETLVEALNQYFSIINEVVFKFEGMLDKFMGDTALAVWGAPFTHEDKEARAVKAALEIQEALREFNISRIKKGYPPFTVGIGIHTGPVVSGNLGSNRHYDYSIIGESLHVVGRLCAMSAPGQTVLSGETYEKVQSLVKAGPLNPIAVRGSMEPLRTYEVQKLL